MLQPAEVKVNLSTGMFKAIKNVKAFWLFQQAAAANTTLAQLEEPLKREEQR